MVRALLTFLRLPGLEGGGRLLRQDVDGLLKAMANQAHAQLDDKEKIQVSAHILRHTMLRKAAEKEGVP